MTLFTQTILRLQQVRCDGQHPEKKIYRHLALTEDKDVFALMAGGDLIRPRRIMIVENKINKNFCCGLEMDI
jgi:hypothetical protein